MPKPYTYSKLIAGANFAYRNHEKLCDKAEDQAEKAYHIYWMKYFLEEIRRYRLTRGVTGDQTVIVR